MNIIKCGIPGCNKYIVEEEAKAVLYNNKLINICESCDDGSYEYVKTNSGGNHGTFYKVEKIKKRKNKPNE